MSLLDWRKLEWPQWRGRHRNGSSDQRVIGRWPTSGPRRQWRCQVNRGYGSIAVSDARVYTLGWDKGFDTLYCIDADIGNVIWTCRYPCKAGATLGSGSTPCVDGRWVYVLSRAGELLSINGDTGQIKWKTDLAGRIGVKPPLKGFTSSPLVMGGLVIADVGTVAAVDRSSGSVAWQSETFAAGYASPAPMNDRLVVMNNDGAAVLREDGLTFCKRAGKGQGEANACDPLVIGDNVFCIFSGIGCAMLQPEFSEFKLIWQGNQLTGLAANPVYWKGLIFGLDGLAAQATLKCIDASDGRVKWTGPAFDNATMIVADGKLILLTESGELVLAEASGEAYKELARAKVMTGQCIAPPALSGGRLYCRNTMGELICLNFR